MANVVRCRSRDLVVVTVAAAGVAVGAFAARSGSFRDVEAGVFGRINGLTDRMHAPAWALMQVGSLGGSIATGAAVAAAGRPRLGRRLAVTGAAAWLASKAAKPLVGRGRPQTVVETPRVRGREQAGLGYPSGHAAVAVAMTVVAAPDVPRRLRPVVWFVALGVGVTRIYVGAHLPLDVAGGIALGVGTGRVGRLLAG
jgi:glycosyltransferase 2 family protein